MLVVKDGNFVKCVNFLRRCITFTQSFGNLTHAWCNVSLKMLRFDTFTFSKKVYKSNNIEWLELLYMLCQCQRLNVMYVSEVLWCSVMYCGIDALWCAVMCCVVLRYAVMCCDVLWCAVMYCAVMYCDALCCDVCISGVERQLSRGVAWIGCSSGKLLSSFLSISDFLVLGFFYLCKIFELPKHIYRLIGIFCQK